MLIDKAHSKRSSVARAQFAPLGLRIVCFVNLIISYPTNEVETRSGSFDVRSNWSHVARVSVAPCGLRIAHIENGVICGSNRVKGEEISLAFNIKILKCPKGQKGRKGLKGHSVAPMGKNYRVKLLQTPKMPFGPFSPCRL